MITKIFIDNPPSVLKKIVSLRGERLPLSLMYCPRVSIPLRTNLREIDKASMPMESKNLSLRELITSLNAQREQKFFFKGTERASQCPWRAKSCPQGN
jgi:hypothetical protein